MLFNSLAFGIFLPIVFFLYWWLPHRYRWLLLLISSYYFYMSWNPKYVILILFTTIVSYIAALLLEKEERRARRKLILGVVLILCLGVLFFFKYFNFFSNSGIALLNKFALNLHPVTLDIMLPVGISFYTFQTLSYVIDVYRKKVKPERHFGIYATFISFFPQLVAGPIERTENLLPQIKSEKNFDYNNSVYGLKLMAWGFFKKLVIADNVAVYVDTVYGSLRTYQGWDLVIVVVFFTIQIYCDFSGYSDIAVGTAKLLGVDLVTNFRSPYFSQSIKKFWSRWHISLSTWFRDYVYIPLGGNRCSAKRHYLNVLITFLVSGLWHGASWTFVIWGGIHGLAQVIEDIFFKWIPVNKSDRMRRIISTFGVFVFCNLTWVFFRAETFSDACYVLRNLLTGITQPAVYFKSSLGFTEIEYAKICVSIFFLAVYDYFSQKIDIIEVISSQKVILRWSVYVAVIMMVILFTPVAAQTAFLYFQF